MSDPPPPTAFTKPDAKAATPSTTSFTTGILLLD